MLATRTHGATLLGLGARGSQDRETLTCRGFLCLEASRRCTPRTSDRLAHPDGQGPSRAGSLCPQGLKALYPPDGGVGAVELLPGDLAHLDDQEFLNDTVIDFYMKRAPLPAPPAVVMGKQCRLLVR